MPLDEAYRLIGMGPVVMVSTISEHGKYDIAPIAWTSPARKNPSRVVIGVGRRHKTFTNIEETGKFIVAVPNISQVEMVKATGSVSGSDIDKFERFKIDCIKGREIDCKIPCGVIGYIECRLLEIYGNDPLALILGEAVCAAVDPAAYDGTRILSESPAGKTVHHLGEKRFMTLGDAVIE
jgi:flavin reductase (DIM6/NTAB) family NADH-FMN oxidoreductase RutF